MPQAVGFASACLVHKSMYVIGGRTGLDPFKNNKAHVQVLDLDTLEWSHDEVGDDDSTIKAHQALVTPRSGMGHCVFVDGLVYVFGGATN